MCGRKEISSKPRNNSSSWRGFLRNFLIPVRLMKIEKGGHTLLYQSEKAVARIWMRRSLKKVQPEEIFSFKFIILRVWTRASIVCQDWSRTPKINLPTRKKKSRILRRKRLKIIGISRYLMHLRKIQEISVWRNSRQQSAGLPSRTKCRSQKNTLLKTLQGLKIKRISSSRTFRVKNNAKILVKMLKEQNKW